MGRGCMGGHPHVGQDDPEVRDVAAVAEAEDEALAEDEVLAEGEEGEGGEWDAGSVSQHDSAPKPVPNGHAA